MNTTHNALDARWTDIAIRRLGNGPTTMYIMTAFAMQTRTVNTMAHMCPKTPWIICLNLGVQAAHTYMISVAMHSASAKYRSVGFVSSMSELRKQHSNLSGVDVIAAGLAGAVLASCLISLFWRPSGQTICGNVRCNIIVDDVDKLQKFPLGESESGWTENPKYWFRQRCSSVQWMYNTLFIKPCIDVENWRWNIDWNLCPRAGWFWVAHKKR